MINENDSLSNAVAITPSDANNLAQPAQRLYVAKVAGGPSDISVQTLLGQIVTFKNVPDGTVLRLRVKRVRATGTTADNIIGMY